MNAAWHERHPMPKRATLEERVAWHRAHQKHCACRPVPASLAARVKSAAKPKAAAPAAARALDARFAPLVKALVNEPGVTHGGKGFGSSGLKVHGKLFVLVSSRGQFVAKLPKQRVAELVEAGKGAFFDPGHGRLMKEWIAIDGAPSSWLRLAREALAYVRGA